MSDCSCSGLPIPSCSGINQLDNECGRIRMFFGYELPEIPPSGSPGFPGKLSKLFYTSPISTDSIQKGFSIPQFSCKILKDSKILDNLDSFTLSEAELLSTGTFESWILFSSYYITKSSPPVPDPAEPFGVLCMKDMQIDIGIFKLEALKMWDSLINNFDTTSIFSGLKTIFGGDVPDPKLKNTGSNNCDALILNQRVEKLKVCYEWFKNIHDTYYGKEFLIKIGGPPASSVPGICIKDETGSDPLITKPFYIDGNGASQGFYTSDEIADGGFPKRGSSDLLGLTNINWVQNSDGKVESFAKIGKISSGTSNECSALQQRYLYKKFMTRNISNGETECVDWNIDLTKLDSSNYYIYDDTLYLKGSVENRFYIDNNGTWIKFSLSEKIPLTPIDINTINGVVMFSYLLDLAAGAAGDGKTGIVDFFNRYLGLNNSITLDGARGNSAQLNLAKSEQPCLFPQGVVIPFKSNVYRYGPYYYTNDPDEGGGTELVIQENIAPWNFIQPNDITFPSNFPYCRMDSFGKELAKLSPKGLQNLEKGRITAAGFPCYKLGESVDNGYDPSKGIGPTLLTDISIDYGAGGFTTTYNFSTYSPRFGKTEKYLLDNWQNNIRNTQYINSYLRSEKEKLDSIQKDYTKKLIEKNYFFAPPQPKHKSSTPNRLFFSGYYIDKNVSTSPSAETYPPPVSSFPQDQECNPSGLIDYSINGDSAPNYSTYPKRRYAFCESAEGYSIEYLQNTYFQLAGMSMDGFFIPVSLRGVGDDPLNKPEFIINNNNVTKNGAWTNKARLPRFAMRCNFDGSFIEWDQVSSDFNNFDKPGYPIPTKTRDEIPPFFLKQSLTQGSGCYLLPINQRYLNPYTTKAILNASNTSAGLQPWDSRKNNTSKGFVISSIVFGDKYTEYQISHTGGDNNNSDTDEHIRQQINNFRVPSLRGPLILQSWGYDTTGKPIPNSADAQINTELGQFRKDQLTDRFQNEWLQNPRSWPVGPIDLRFDRERGVWTCPSPNKIIVARLKEELLCGQSAKAELLNPKADNINFYEKYFISGPNGENIKLNMDQTEITVYDFLGENIPACTKIYVYYDDNRYIVLRSADDPNISGIVRFRAIKLCNTNEEDPSDYYGDNTWGAYAGYGDKYYNYHIYGVRIDCDGEAIDIFGKKSEEVITEQFLIDNAKDWLIKLQDNAGKFGPSYARFKNYTDWKANAATGYASLIGLSITTSCTEESPSPSGSGLPDCILGQPIECTSKIGDADEDLIVYDILFIESYARFLHGCLDQDLYLTKAKAEQKYPWDDYKTTYPSGNASVGSGLIFYGDSPNGRYPLFLSDTGSLLPIRVFDPWLDENLNPIPCYTPEESEFYNVTSGTPFTAVFNEKTKKYYIWNVLKKKDKNIIRFKAIKFCNNGNDNVEDAYKGNWGEYAGYGDKFHNYDTYGVRINCDGDIIDKQGKTSNNNNIDKDFFIDNAENWLVRLNDNAGKFGPSYSIFTNFDDWNSKAATGYAALIDDNSDAQDLECILGEPIDCDILTTGNIQNYDILFIESYARFLHGCLKQDLYINSEQAEEKYSNDTYKIQNPSGNASVNASGLIFYGDAPNGKEPIFLDENYENLDIRVFDPWLDDNLNPISCYNPRDSIFYTATSGTPFTAIFNEKEKKYYLWQIDKKQRSIVRFKLIDLCSNPATPIYQDNAILDPWVSYAGYLDKFPNNHCLAVRINCDGEPVDIKGNIINKDDLLDANKIKDIFINVYDSVGIHGPAYAHMNADGSDFATWKNRASTGFAALCEIPPEDNCLLGYDSGQCSTPDTDYPSYDILFLDTYARFVQCELLQDLYVTSDEASVIYADDEYKTGFPAGNAAANIEDFYGDSPNGRQPKFYSSDLQEVPFRVFDPFIDANQDNNPFRKLKTGDKVLAVFNENLKKYMIWQSLRRDDSIIKFALTSDKNVTDVLATGVLVDEYGRPIDRMNKLLTDDTFEAEQFIIRDPFASRSSLAPIPAGTLQGELTAFGPALGSNILNEHYNGIPLGDGFGPQYVAPFIGFAIKKYNANNQIVYEMFQLEHYARYVFGRVCTKKPTFNNYYLGSKSNFGYKEGRNPIARQTASLPRGDLIINHPMSEFTGVHSFFLGDGGEGSGNRYSNTDGCAFIALLDSSSSTTNNLIYQVVEAERAALVGTIIINTQSKADELNNNNFDISVDNSDMVSIWEQGWMWNQALSADNFNLMKIKNRNEFINRGLFIKGSVFTVTLSGIDNSGNLEYTVVAGGTIAKVAHRYIHNSQPGLFGCPGAVPATDMKIDGSDNFMNGLDPSILDDIDKPIFNIIPDQQWMTFGSGIISAVWDETLDANGSIKNGQYKIIYAQQAPVIITGKAYAEVDPLNPQNNILLSIDNNDLYSSCQGVNKIPINDGPILLHKVRNFMGHGAKIGDHVTIQRVYTGVAQNQANYYYMIIGTGDPPGSLK